MADQKLTELAALASPTTDDLLYVVDDPAGTPASRKATIAAVLAIAVPTGGTAGQVLTKDSGTDFDTSWATPSGGTSVIDSSRPNITVTNTATETDVYTITLPGGTLGTINSVHLRLVGGKLKNGGGSDNAMVMKVYYDSTVLFGIPVPTVSADSTTLNPVILDVYLSGNGATNAQIAHGVIATSTNPDTTGGTNGAVGAKFGTAAVDSTADHTLKVTWTQAATPDHAYTSHHGYVATE